MSWRGFGENSKNGGEVMPPRRPARGTSYGCLCDALSPFGAGAGESHLSAGKDPLLQEEFDPEGINLRRTAASEILMIPSAAPYDDPPKAHDDRHAPRGGLRFAI